MIDRSTIANEVGVAAAKLFLPAGVTIGTVLGAINPQWVIAIPTAMFAVAQLAYLLWRWHREAKAKSGSA